MGAAYVLHADQSRAQHELTDQLQQALESRDVIGQAKGLLMTRHAVTADVAFEMLRRASQDTNVKLRELAKKLVVSG
jgi:AmiR/NasT family two-component response regulator